MIRSASILLTFALLVPASLAQAQNNSHSPKTKASSHRKAASKKGSDADSTSAPAKAAAAKPSLIGAFGPWGAYVAAGKAPTCYVLSQPQQRAPETLKRDPAYVFISTRPAEHVRDEVSIVMGFDVKDDDTTPAQAKIGKTAFDMIAKGGDLWLKDENQQGAMLAAMRKGDRMVVKAASKRGNLTTDTYSLAGLTQALEHVMKSCK